MTKLSRRTLLQGTGVLALAGLPPTRVLSSAPPAEAITPELIAAAKKEGQVRYYTSVDLAMAERISKVFEARFPGISVKVERTGAERVFQRIGQEYSQPDPLGRRGQLVGRRAFHRLEAQRLACALRAEDVAKFTPPSTRTRTASSRASA